MEREIKGNLSFTMSSSPSALAFPLSAPRIPNIMHSTLFITSATFFLFTVIVASPTPSVDTVKTNVARNLHGKAFDSGTKFARSTFLVAQAQTLIPSIAIKVARSDSSWGCTVSKQALCCSSDLPDNSWCFSAGTGVTRGSYAVFPGSW